MSRKKRAVAQSWDAIDKQRDEANKPEEETEKKKLTQEEHDERIRTLRELGLIK